MQLSVKKNPELFPANIESLLCDIPMPLPIVLIAVIESFLVHNAKTVFHVQHVDKNQKEICFAAIKDVFWSGNIIEYTMFQMSTILDFEKVYPYVKRGQALEEPLKITKIFLDYATDAPQGSTFHLIGNKFQFNVFFHYLNNKCSIFG
jgi:hypothetical protein